MEKPSFYSYAGDGNKANGRSIICDKDRFLHPSDKSALAAFKSLPGVNTITKKIMEGVIEKAYIGNAFATKIEVNDRQYPHIFRAFLITCEKLSVKKIPLLFVELNPVPNAYTYGGVKEQFITLTSGLVEMLSEDELQVAIAHELGHIICEHPLYHTTLHLLLTAGGALLPGLVLEPVIISGYCWERMSEYSADRVAALYAGEHLADVTLLRMGGMPRQLVENIDLETYLRQADKYEERMNAVSDSAIMNLMIAHQNHPYLVNRIKENISWCKSITYQNLRRGNK